MSHTKSRLGKGLEALIPKTQLTSGKTIMQIPTTDIRANKYQPRLTFDDGAIKTLSESIKRFGLNQPIMVRRSGNHYELIAGERRFRACLMANLERVPAIIKEVSDKESLQLALIENLEREDLNKIEEALGYQQLIEEFGFSHQEVADIVGKSRSNITNTIRLLQLPDSVREAIVQGNISSGHARSLLGIENEEELLKEFRNLVMHGGNVRDVEQRVAVIKQEKTVKKRNSASIELQERLENALGCRVKVKGTLNKGSIEITYKNNESLESLITKLID